jgi:hypothetical protein
MTWFKLDDQFPDHPKVVAAGADAAWLFVAAGCYAAKHATDGRVPKTMLLRLTDQKNPQKLTARLIEVGLFHDRGDEIEVHDFLDYNPSKAETEARRDAKRIAGAKGAAIRWHGSVPSESHVPRDAPDPTRPAVPNGTERPRRKRRPPVDFDPTDAHRAFALEGGLDLDKERDGWITWCEAQGRTYANLNAGFTTWLHRAVEFGRGGRPIATYAELTGEPKRCATCANTGHYFDGSGEFVECDHGRVA